MTTHEHDTGAAAVAALEAAAASLHEQLDALDSSIEYHERRARELRETRKRVKAVERLVAAPSPNGRGRRPGPVSDAARQAIAERTKRRHAEERAAKKARVLDLVRTYDGPNDEIRAVDLLAMLNEGVGPNDPKRKVGRQLVVDLCAELRDEGVLRLDRLGAGGQQVYRLVVAHE